MPFFPYKQTDLDEAEIQSTYANFWDAKLNFECDETKGEAIVSIKSVFSKVRGDRRYQFSCAKVADSPAKDCQWHNNINNWQEPIGFTCPSDFYIAGLKSYHINSKEDRRWSVKCCRSLGYRTESCELTKEYINALQGSMDYEAKLSGCAGDNAQSFFTGFQSYHNAGKE